MNLNINEIIDVPTNQKLLDSFCHSVGIAAAIIDLEGNVIIGSRWQKICTDFYRANRLSSAKCIESDTLLANRLQKGEKYSLYRCQHGLMDAASPIMVQGRPIANVFVGQFLTGPPNANDFKRQAKTYGFDEKTFFQALSGVPIIEEKKVPVITSFLVSYAEMLAGIVLEHKKQLASERRLIKRAQVLAEHNEAAKVIEADHKRTLAILDGIDDVIYVSDPETYELLHVNETAKRYWGEDIIGKKCHTVLQNRDKPCPFCTNSTIFGEFLGRPYIWEFQNEVTKNWYRCSDRAIPWVDGRMVRFEIAADITQLKVMEEALKAKNDDLERSNKELEQFAYVASHDLQEPLRMVASYTELLDEMYKGKLDRKADKYIAYAVEGAKRMQQLINDLLALSRVNTRGKPFEPVDCGELVKKVLHGLGGILADKQADIRVDTLPVIMGDRVQLFQLFQNLISNAIKFHGVEKPLVKLSAKQQDSKWIFSIQDNGIGIDPQFFERIFVIFQRLHERNSYQGTGIGLSISKKIVERHGGKIWVESEPGHGSTFYFSLQDGKREKRRLTDER